MTAVAAVSITLAGYIGAKWLNRRIPHIHPLLIATLSVWLIWMGLGGDWGSYTTGGEWVSFWLGPATVALAVPLAKHIRQLAHLWPGVIMGVAAGCGVSLLSGWALAQLFASDGQIFRSMLTKSVTTPFSVELTLRAGGVPALAGMFSVVTGMIGALMARPLLKLTGIHTEWAIGLGVGTSSHAIGTASLPQNAAAQTAASSLAMILSGIVTSLYLLLFP